MKLNRDVSPVQRGGVKSESTFTIQTSAHAFEILSSGLYTDSVTAIVRELSCNAYDSHVDAGKRDVPFDMHVPTRLEPWFAIRDYGTGLSNDDVLSIYTTYFQSTKSNSDDFIGALGLGSKSPFAYSDNFQVTSFFEGVEYKYAIFLNEAGVPSVALMGEAVSDQPNGIEVRIPSEEHRRFKDAISRYLAYFTVKPHLIGIDKTDTDKMYTDVRQPAGSELDEDGKWFVADKDRGYYSARTGIVYGQVPYPANVDKIVSGCRDDANPLCTQAELSFYRSFSDQLVMIFEVGDLSITANREELKYDEATLKSIANRISEFHKKFFVSVKKAIESFADNDSLYKTNRYLMDEVFNGEAKFFKSINFDDINCDEIKRLAECQSHWGNGFALYVGEAVKSANLFDVTKLEYYRSNATGEMKVRNPKGGNYDCLGISQEMVYYVIDEPRNGVNKAKQHYLKTKGDHSHNTAFIVLKPKNIKECGDAAHEAQVAEMKHALGNPDFILTSTLDYEKPVRQKSTVSRKQVGTVFNNAPYWNTKHDLDFEDGGIYIYLAGGSKVYSGSKAIPENDIFRDYSKNHSFFRSMIEIYNDVHGTEYTTDDLIGVSAADIKIFDKSDDWTNILETVETHVKDNQEAMQIKRHQYDTVRNSHTYIGSDVDSDFMATFKGIAGGLTSKCDSRTKIIKQMGQNKLTEVLDTYVALEASLDVLRTEAHGYESLLHVFGDYQYRTSTTQDNRFIVNLDAELNEVMKQYPLLSMLARYCGLHEDKALQTVIDYVIMIDNANTQTNTTGNP